MMSASLSHIYPSLRRLHERGLVSYTDQPIKNRLAKKIYEITPAGEQALDEWLRSPVEENEINFTPFMLRMSFSPLMPKAVILEHIDREIERRARNLRERDRGRSIEMAYLDKTSLEPARAAILWQGIYAIGLETSRLRLAWLKEWRETVEQEIE